MDFLESNSADDEAIKETVEKSREKNQEFRKESPPPPSPSPPSSRELNDISMLMFRVKAISMMVVAATDVFISNVNKMLKMDIPEGFELIDNSCCKNPPPVDSDGAQIQRCAII